MRPSPLLLALVLACAAPVAFGQMQEDQDDDHAAHHSAEPSTEAPAMAEHDHGAAGVDARQDNMKHIESLMKDIQQTTDPERKRTLLGEHLAAMLDQMTLIRSQGGGMKAAMTAHETKKGDMMGGMMKGGGMMQMHKKIEQRVDLLERLLQQTLEREAAEESLDSH